MEQQTNVLQLCVHGHRTPDLAPAGGHAAIILLIINGRGEHNLPR